MLKRNDPFALPDFVQKCNDNNAKINVREVVKLLRESSIKHPRDLLRVNGEDLLETIGVDKKDLARALREKLGIWTEEEEKEVQREERKKAREERKMDREKEYREEKEKLAASTKREEMILEKKRMKQAERQRRKEEEGKEEEAVKLKVHILEENEENKNSSISSSSSSPLQSPVKNTKTNETENTHGSSVRRRTSDAKKLAAGKLSSELFRSPRLVTKRTHENENVPHSTTTWASGSTNCKRHGEQIRRAHTRYLRLARERERIQSRRFEIALDAFSEHESKRRGRDVRLLAISHRRKRHLGKLRIAHHEKLHSYCKVYVRR